MEFAQRLKQTMENKSVTMYRLAKELGVHQTTIKNWLNGKGEPRLKQFQRIASALDVDVNWLMNGQTLEERDQAWKDKVARLYEEANSWKEGKDRINAAFDSLNTSGQQEAVKRVEELTEIPRYQAQPPAEAPPASPKDTDTPTPQDAPEGAEEGE